MTVDLLKSDLVVAVFGAGTMGRGIAQVCAQAGIDTLLYDARAGAVDEAIAAVGKGLDGQVAKGRITEDAKRAVMAKLKPMSSLAEAKPAGLVIEAIVEDLGVKRDLFQKLEKILAADAVIATNTSSLSVTEIAAGCSKPERVGGLHFFNPPPVMKLVEVIAGLRSDPSLADALIAVTKRIAKTPIVATDTPGFVVNHAGRAYGPEALRIVGQGIASPREVDELMKEAAGFRMGPFELLDLIGGDVTHAVMESMYGRYYEEPMYQPSALLATRVAGGLLGRKSGAGFYDYKNAEAPSAPTIAVVPQPVPTAAWVADEDGGRDLAAVLEANGVKVTIGGAPAKGALCFVTPLGEDCTGAALRLKLDPANVVAVDMLGRFGKRLTVMKNPLTAPDMLGQAVAALAAGGAVVTAINDSTGFVTQRLLSMIVNIGTRIAELRVAAPADIDTAVELGLNYPKGPLALGDALGSSRVLAVLDGMFALTHDPKYRATNWLRRRAALGVSLRTPD
ncbi:3-hydroxyacyl-CoA dehydrogenase [Pseudolabrys sp. Root1462]|uniref:3-hydroxyacyl-CoA dehydrogenase n=1 Tax=Pseudolabrys sp. Root1462 TaxID=1736466 RepID=UPI000703413C|nr:3-hydroxyacyl-CoA dehydrogenase [Pseudolabrys sp. Root1462]KQZ00847.1 3-hydroxyacyl-CoA dehydrogenase [Pseudolabrys sp. Root1462]